MYNYSTQMSPSRILDFIFSSLDAKKKTYIITGKPVKTGKTWLTRQLTNNGYNAIEISELIHSEVEYIKRGNSFIEQGDIVCIILNMEV